MALWLRVLLWIVVALVPGGLLLAPVLIGDAWRRKRNHPGPVAEKPEDDPSVHFERSTHAST